MRLRLFAFLTAFVILMVSVVVIILLLSGPFAGGMRDVEDFMEREVTRVSRSLASRLGDTSLQLVRLSESLSRSLEARMQGKGLQLRNLQNHPEVLEALIEEELDRLLLALERTRSSGVFMVLDATINPYLEGAWFSRAGMSIRIIEPELSGPEMPRRLVRGFPRIAYNSGMTLQSAWDMEFNVRERAYFHLPIAKYNETRLPLSRIYHWGFESVISADRETMLLCSVPLVDYAGRAFGVCGFEFSGHNFNTHFTPDTSRFRNAFFMLSAIGDRGPETRRALFSGYYATQNPIQDTGPLTVSYGTGLNTYTTPQGRQFMGLHREIKLLPDNSVFADSRYALSFLIPKADLDDIIRTTNLRLVFISVGLLILGISVSVFISRKYLNPILSVFDNIYSDHVDDAAKTNIHEIDRLVELIREMRAKEHSNSDSGSKLSQIDALTQEEYEAFKLSPREKEVARLMLQGLTMRQTAAHLGIAESTVNGYCGSLYKKLGINSRTELFVRLKISVDNETDGLPLK